MSNTSSWSAYLPHQIPFQAPSILRKIYAVQSLLHSAGGYASACSARTRAERSANQSRCGRLPETFLTKSSLDGGFR